MADANDLAARDAARPSSSSFGPLMATARTSPSGLPVMGNEDGDDVDEDDDEQEEDDDDEEDAEEGESDDEGDDVDDAELTSAAGDTSRRLASPPRPLPPSARDRHDAAPVVAAAESAPRAAGGGRNQAAQYLEVDRKPGMGMDAGAATHAGGYWPPPPPSSWQPARQQSYTAGSPPQAAVSGREYSSYPVDRAATAASAIASSSSASGAARAPTSTSNPAKASSSTAAAAASASGGDPTKRKIACMACRTIKLKCLLARPDATADEPCKRCAKVGVLCEYKPKRRPRKTTVALDGNETGKKSGPMGGRLRAESGKEHSGLTTSTASNPHLSGPDAGPSTSSSSVRSHDYALQPPPGPSPASASASRSRHHEHSMSSLPLTYSQLDPALHRHPPSPFQQHQQHGPPFNRSSLPSASPSTSSGNMAFDFRKSLAQQGMGGVGAQGDGFSTAAAPARRDPTVFMNPHVPAAAAMSSWDQAAVESSVGHAGYVGIGPGSSAIAATGRLHNAPPLDLGLSPRTAAFIASGASPSSVLLPSASTPAAIKMNTSSSVALGSYGGSMEPFRSSSERSTIHRTSRGDIRDDIGAIGPSPVPNSTPSEISASAQPPHTNASTVSSHGANDREQASRTRYPMALTSVLDLIRRDLSPPPTTPSRAHSSSEPNVKTAADSSSMQRYSRSPHVDRHDSPDTHDDGERAPYRVNADEHDREPVDRPHRRRSSVWTEHRDDDSSEPPRKRARWVSETEDSMTVGLMSQQGPLSRHDDPVGLGLLGREEEAYLFERYFDRLNAYIALLDPVLHTPSYVFNTSPVLYAAVLTATAHCFLPERYQGLLSHVRGLLGKAFANGDANIGLCQALSLLSVWKDVGDKGSWLRVGYAIRVGYEIGLSAKPRRPLPVDETEAREELNRERTWWQLTAFDRTMGHLHGRRQRMITPDATRTIASYLLDHPHLYCNSDAMLTTSLVSGDITDALSQSYRFEQDNVGWKILLHRLEHDLRQWQEDWLGDHAPLPLQPLSRTIVGFYSLIIEFELAEFTRTASPSGNTASALARSCEKAISLLRYIVGQLAPAEVLRFAPDVVTIRGAKAGVFLARNASRFDPSVNAEITAIFRQLIQVCRSASLEDCDTAYYQARFFSSLLRVSSVAPTRQASRAGSPSAEAAASAAAASGLQGMPSDALISGLDMNRLIGDSVGLRHDVVADGFPDLDQELTIDGLLQESHDWFSVDLMAHMNDPLYAPPAVITLPTTFIGNG